MKATALLCGCCIQVLAALSDALSHSQHAPQQPKITIVQSSASSSPPNHDVQALADLRYDEWIAPPETTTATTTTSTSTTTSRHAFYRATAEIHQERCELGAVAFLARDDNDVAVGSAELSPIELQGAITGTVMSCSVHKMLYVTDVLTARSHRRKGVAKALMEAMEQYASLANTQAQAALLLLHVKSSNLAALQFYRNLGYDNRLPDELGALLDTDRLAENAGTVGQMLFGKVLPTLSNTGASTTISEDASNNNNASKKRRKRDSGGRGFGAQ